ncbi:MAG: tyrosine-type recombinase/integrase, partial [Polyangiaceae bacterium]|nr:tyrosine-type recombinase/integrase [Polyangiaceae bacterium]
MVFRSGLAEDMRAYLELKRATGFKAKGAEKILRLLDRYLAQHHPSAQELSTPILRAWLEHRDLRPATRALRVVAARQLCLYRRRTNASAYVPGRRRDRVLWPTALPKFVPHIFTVEEVRQALQGALNLRPRGSNTQRPRTFVTLLLVLYATGLRISEAQALRIGDVNLEDGTLLIRESKFFKARVVP